MPVPPTPADRHRRVSARWRLLLVPTWLLVIIEVLTGAVLLAIAINTATSTNHFPGPLDIVRRHPWPATLVVAVILALIALELYRRQAGRPDRRGLPAQTSGPETPLSVAEPPRWRRERPQWREQLLAQVRSIWIDGFLHRSLADVIRVNLDLAERPSMVIPSWGALDHRSGQSAEQFAPSTSIRQVADQFDGRLLILGAPGAGKSTLLLELARDWVEDAERDTDKPIPAVFHLSGWPAEQPPLDRWLADELRRHYYLPRWVANQLVDNDELAVLLDGLDEVPTNRRAACAAAVNALRDEHARMPLVVCARTHDFQDLGTVLDLEVAVEINPLTRAQVRGWLEMAGESLAALREVLSNESHSLWAMLDTPLILAIATLTYNNQLTGAIRVDGLGQLFDAYTMRMLNRPRAPLAPREERARYTIADTLRWLGWLAGQIAPGGTFYPDLLTPAWLPTRSQRRVATTGPALLVGVSIGLYIATMLGLPWGIGLGLWFTLGTVMTGMNPMYAVGPGLLAQFSRRVRTKVATTPGAHIHLIPQTAFIGALAMGLATIPAAPGKLVPALLGGLAGGLVCGAGWLSNRLTVRLLARNRLLPTDLLEFLEYIDDRILLRRAGAGYLFVHRLLQEHLATTQPLHR